MASFRVVVASLLARRGVPSCQRSTAATAAAAYRGLSTSAAALGDNEVALSILAAPVTAADMDSKSPAGAEGVGIVTAVGSKVKDLAVHDWVVPTSGSVPTFRSAAKAKEVDLAKVPSDIPVEFAACMGTALTALRLLSGVKGGEYVLQADADSPVGLAVVQIAQARGVGTINIVTDGPGFFDKAGLIKDLGGDVVVKDTYATGNAGFAKILSELPKPSLALAATEAGSAVVGKVGMGLKANLYATAGESSLKKATASEIESAASMFRSGALQLWVERHPLSDLPVALKEASEPFKTRKVVVMINEPPRPKVDEAKLSADFEKAFQKLKA
ncbi:trans-2-enoyl-reductase [Nannochloropsis oceanica]